MRLALALVVMLVACDAKTEPGNGGSASGSKEYSVDVSGPQAAGSETSCTLTVTPHEPWVLKAETPFNATLTTSAGLKVEKSKLDARDFVDAKAAAKAVKTDCVAESAGEHQLGAKLSFFLCTAEICKRMTDQVTVTISAK